MQMQNRGVLLLGDVMQNRGVLLLGGAMQNRGLLLGGALKNSKKSRKVGHHLGGEKLRLLHEERPALTGHHCGYQVGM